MKAFSCRDTHPHRELVNLLSVQLGGIPDSNPAFLLVDGEAPGVVDEVVQEVRVVALRRSSGYATVAIILSGDVRGDAPNWDSF